MLILLSPAKTIDFNVSPTTAVSSLPMFPNLSEKLVRKLRRKSENELRELMNISPKLAGLNAARFAAWEKEHSHENAKPAGFVFKGDVYTGLDIDSFSEADLEYAQDHLRILSGLYGILKPLDLIQAYRLEMGSKLKTKTFNGLYDFWGTRITRAVKDAAATAENQWIINLASNEYFKSIQHKKLDNSIISPEFRDWRNGEYKMISFFAKKARGLMASYLIKNRIQDEEGILMFQSDGYSYNDQLSAKDKPVFTREKQ